MADPEHEIHMYFGNSDSEGEFEGFEQREVDNFMEVPDCLEYNAEMIVGDENLATDVRNGWTHECQPPLIPPFTGTPGLTVEIDELAEPIDYFKLFVDDEDFDRIAFETNRYFAQISAVRQPKPHARMNSWFDTTAPEMKKLFGLTFLMGLVDKPHHVVTGQQIHFYQHLLLQKPCPGTDS